MAGVRRRSGDAVRHITDLPSIQEDNSEAIAGIHSSLVEKGKRLYDKATESGFKETKKLAEGLSMFIDAAGVGSRDAIDELKNFFVTTSQKRLEFVLDQLPRDLLSSAKVLVEGSETEKQVFMVAKDMFKTMANGGKDIKKDDIDNATTRLLTAEAVCVGGEEVKLTNALKGSVKRLLKFGLKTNEFGEEVVTEQAFCLVACQYARGELVLPLETDDYRMSPKQYSEFLAANWIKKATEYPRLTAHYLGHYSLKTVEKHGVRWVWSYLPTKQLYLMMLVYILPLISLSIVLSTISTIVFFGAFLTMIISTLQIVANWRRINWFMEYSTIFRYFSEHGRTINTREPEAKLLKHTAMPYVSFSISAVATVFTISMAYQVIMIYELLFILSTVMTAFVFVRFKCWESPIILGSICLRLLSWSVVFLSLIEEWVPVPGFLFVVDKGIFSISLFSGISVEINFVTLVQIPMQVLLLLGLFFRSSLRDLLLAIGSYVLFMMWWIFSKQIFVHCSILYLGLFMPAVFLLFFLTPVIPLALLVSPLVCYVYFGMSIEFLLCTSAVVLLGIGCLLVLMNYHRLKESKWLNIRLEYLFLIQICLCLPAMYIGASYYTSIHKPSNLPVVTAEQYKQFCSTTDSPLDQDNYYNSIQSQINCIHLEGRMLSGKAQTSSVAISAVKNDYVEMVNKFPSPLNLAMTCFLGERDPICGELPANSPTCLFKGCHFDSSNDYTVTVKAMIKTSSNDAIPVKLQTVISHKHIKKSNLLMLKRNTIFDFNATMVSGMGTAQDLVLNIRRIEYAVRDQNKLLTNYSYDDTSEHKEHKDSKRSSNVISQLLHSVKSVVGFVLETFFGYTLSHS